MSIKPSLFFLGITVSILLSGCTPQNESLAAEETESPVWHEPTVEKSEHFTELNLDAAGGNDDEAVITTYRWEGPSENTYTLLSIKLGTGEILSKGFQGWLDFTFQTGRITSYTRDAIVLEASSKTSNMCAATVYILEIEEDEAGIYLRETGIIGNFDERPIRANCVDVPLLTIGTGIIEGNTNELDKIQLFEVDADSSSGEDISHTLSWDGVNWTYG